MDALLLLTLFVLSFLSLTQADIDTINCTSSQVATLEKLKPYALDMTEQSLQTFRLAQQEQARENGTSHKTADGLSPAFARLLIRDSFGADAVQFGATSANSYAGYITDLFQRIRTALLDDSIPIVCTTASNSRENQHCNGNESLMAFVHSLVDVQNKTVWIHPTFSRMFVCPAMLQKIEDLSNTTDAASQFYWRYYARILIHELCHLPVLSLEKLSKMATRLTTLRLLLLMQCSSQGHVR